VAMPIDLVLVRHGQSEQNLASHLAKHGDSSLYTEAFRSRHGSQHRLTAKGRQQADKAGKWLRANGLEYFDRRYASAYVRAKETAGLLSVDGPDWIVEPLLREREWGDWDGMSPEDRAVRSAESLRVKDTDPFYWIPPNGESIAQLTNRLRPILNTLHRECSDKRVVIVCHGEVMWAFRFILERMSIDRWQGLEGSREPGVKIFNCQVLHYTRRNPGSGKLADHLDWLRSVSPADPSNSGPGWETIKRHRYSNVELLAQAEQVKPLFPDHKGY
jgi:NAD+ kinase